MAKPATFTNEYDAQVVNGALSRIDAIDAELKSEQGTYMSRCRGLRDQIKGVIDDAKNKGIPSKEFKVLLAIRRLEKKNQQLFTDLEPEEQDTLALLAATEKVMDLPLWRVSTPPPSRKPGVDVARHAAGEHPDGPMFTDEDTQGLRYANFKAI